MRGTGREGGDAVYLSNNHHHGVENRGICGGGREGGVEGSRGLWDRDSRWRAEGRAEGEGWVRGWRGGSQ